MVTKSKGVDSIPSVARQSTFLYFIDVGRMYTLYAQWHLIGAGAITAASTVNMYCCYNGNKVLTDLARHLNIFSAWDVQLRPCSHCNKFYVLHVVLLLSYRFCKTRFTVVGEAIHLWCRSINWSSNISVHRCRYWWTGALVRCKLGSHEFVCLMSCYLPFTHVISDGVKKSLEWIIETLMDEMETFLCMLLDVLVAQNRNWITEIQQIALPITVTSGHFSIRRVWRDWT